MRGLAEAIGRELRPARTSETELADPEAPDETRRSQIASCRPSRPASEAAFDRAEPRSEGLRRSRSAQKNEAEGPTTASAAGPGSSRRRLRMTEVTGRMEPGLPDPRRPDPFPAAEPGVGRAAGEAAAAARAPAAAAALVAAAACSLVIAARAPAIKEDE